MADMATEFVCRKLSKYGFSQLRRLRLSDIRVFANNRLIFEELLSTLVVISMYDLTENLDDSTAKDHS